MCWSFCTSIVYFELVSWWSNKIFFISSLMRVKSGSSDDFQYPVNHAMTDVTLSRMVWSSTIWASAVTLRHPVSSFPPIARVNSTLEFLRIWLTLSSPDLVIIQSLLSYVVKESIRTRGWSPSNVARCISPPAWKCGYTSDNVIFSGYSFFISEVSWIGIIRYDIKASAN